MSTRHVYRVYVRATAEQVWQARALAALGRPEESLDAWRAARAVPVDDPEDRAIVEADFADAPVPA